MGGKEGREQGNEWEGGREGGRDQESETPHTKMVRGVGILRMCFAFGNTILRVGKGWGVVDNSIQPL